MKWKESWSKDAQHLTVFYILLTIFSLSVLTLFVVDPLRLFKTLYPRWTETTTFGGVEFVLLLIFIIGGISGYYYSKIRFQTEEKSEITTLSVLIRIYRPALFSSIPFILFSSVIGYNLIQGAFGILVLVSNIANVFSTMFFACTIGGIVFVRNYGTSLNDKVEETHNKWIEWSIILSVILIICLRVIQSVFVSSLISWDTVYHNQVIQQIINGGSYIQHPFYSDMTNLYPPLYHLMMASLYLITGLSMELLVIVKEIFVFLLIAISVYYLSKNLGFSRNASLLTMPISFAFLPGVGNQPQSFAFLLYIIMLNFLVLSQQKDSIKHSIVAGIFCGLLISTHFGLAIAAAVVLAADFLYLFVKQSYRNAGFVTNTLWISASVGSVSILQMASIFPLGGSITIIYLGSIGICLALSILLIFVIPKFTKPQVVAPESSKYQSQPSLKTSVVNPIVWVFILIISIVGVIWGILVGNHGYGQIAYGLIGIFGPFGIVSIVILPASIGGYFELSNSSNLAKKGIMYAAVFPAILGFISYQIEPYMSFLALRQFDGIKFIFTFNPYYLQLSLVAFAPVSSYYIVQCFIPNLSQIKRLSEIRIISKYVKIKKFGVILLIFTIVLTGSLSGRVAELTQGVKQSTTQEIQPSELEIFELVGNLTNDHDTVLSDAYTSIYIPVYSGRNVYFSIHDTANNFRINEVLDRVRLIDSILNGPESQIVLGIQSLQIDAVFIWKQYPCYFRNSSDINIDFYFDITSCINVLKASPLITILSETDSYVLFEI